MARDRLLECSFLIPLRRDRNLSDGKPHRPGAWKWLSTRLYEEWQGGTRSREPQEGWYQEPDTGERVTDLSHKYTVALPREEVGLRALLREACGVFAQKCIYLSVAGYVEFVEGPPHETH